jgi:pimeloyl-ACP methyl ester carboxylesterase
LPVLRRACVAMAANRGGTRYEERVVLRGCDSEGAGRESGSSQGREDRPKRDSDRGEVSVRRRTRMPSADRLTVTSLRWGRSLLGLPRKVVVRGVGAIVPDQAENLPAGCSIGWQPSVFTPVFYGHRDYTLHFPLRPVVAHAGFDFPGPGAELPGITARCRVFFPSVDGSPDGAPILRNCGRYPLVIFAHGHCGEADHFEKWFELPATLARCGNVVIVPDLPLTNGGTSPSENDEEVELLRRLIRWARTDWEFRHVLLPDPATGLAGHSFGAGLSGRLVIEGAIPVKAHASLSGHSSSALLSRPIPKLLTWGTGGEDLLVPVEDWSTRLPAPAHVVEIHEAGHWDYLPQGRSTCTGQRGACTLVPTLAADVVALFFARYMPPERWAASGRFWWLPWFRVRPSLQPPPLLLTTEQKFFAGGHLASWGLLDERSECALTLNWKTFEGSGSLVVD